LDTHRVLLDALAQELIAHETVDAQQLDALLEAARLSPPHLDGVTPTVATPSS
jgi:ATP-dependent Zn protease